jgi:hypothetical protein
VTIQPGEPPNQTRTTRPVGEPPNRTRTQLPERNALGYEFEVIDLEPEEDFSFEASQTRERQRRLDYSDSYRFINKKINETSRQNKRAVELGLNPAASAGTPKYSFFQQQAENLISREAKRLGASPNIDSYPTIKRYIEEASKMGVEITPNDVKNLVDFGIANEAADRFIAAANVRDDVGATNILVTLQDNDPLMASIVPDIVQEKLQEVIEDPTWIQRFIEGAVKGATLMLAPFVLANEEAQHRYRAGQWNLDQNSNNPEFAFRHILYGIFSNDAIDATAKDKFNENYIKEIIESGEYTDLQVQIALDVTKQAVSGDPDAIINVWQGKYAGNEEAAPIFRDIIYRRAEGNTQELLRQIDSAYLGNTGQITFGAALPDAVYDPYRGSEFRQDAANATGFGVSMAVDPTLAAGRAVRMIQASKWALSRLAPGAGSANDVIRKVRLGRLEFSNPAYRFFDSFANDLNRLDDLERRAREATGLEKTNLNMEVAAQRNRITRQYDEMPEDVIEDFRMTARDPEGKFSAEAIAAVIDDMNDAHMISMNQISERLALHGANRNALEEALIEVRRTPDIDPRAISRIEDDLRETNRALTQTERELAETARSSFIGRVASSNEKRTALIPRETIAAKVRKDLVNRIAFSMMPKAKAARLADEYLAADGDPALFAQALSDNAVPLGADAKSYKKSLEGVFDAFGRMFSSIPSNHRISVKSAKDAKSVYRYARMFFPKRTAELIADAFRQGDEGSRRLLLSGLVRSAAASRGFTMTVQDGDTFVRVLTPSARDLVTGTSAGERYGVSVAAGLKPSEKAAAVAAGRQIDEEIASGPLRSLSQDSAGVEHALHLSQTADNVVLPTIRDLEELRTGLVPGLGKGLGAVTDWWSLLTLYGLRFAMRNAIEEVGLYWLTGGKITDLYRGRKLSQAIRRIRPYITIKNVDGRPVPEYKPGLGMVAQRADRISNWMKHKGFPEWSADLIFRGIDNESLLAANVALAQGNTRAFANLAVQSLGTQRVFGFGPKTNLLRRDDEIAFNYLADSLHGIQLLDEIAEAGRFLNSGGFPAYVNATRGIGDAPPGVEYGRIPESRLGDFGNVRPVSRNEAQRNVYGTSFWWRELQTTIDGDGPIGEAAVLYLTDPVRGKAEIARIIREDTEYRYKQRFSRLRSDGDIDQFADDYFENVFQHFTRADGSLNTNLRLRFIDVNDEGEEFVSWWRPIDPETGTTTPRLSSSDLLEYNVRDRPEYIFGREVIYEPYIPMPLNEASLLSQDRLFGWMGKQNARISREPVFLANYIDQFRKTADARRMFATSLAKRRRGDDAVPTEDEMELANKVYANVSMDNAFNLTLSYVDNPANRSNLAWKARNVSRYYRASEDFYRRIKRVAKNNPEAFWKGALTYQLLGDYGFTYRDDNGEMYFAYPGNQLLQASVGRLAGALLGIPMGQYVDLAPFSINGRLLGVAPSTDPNQLAPSLMGPITAPLAAIYSAFPALAGLRSLTLGSYSQSTGDPLADAVRAIIPAGVARILQATDTEQMDASVAQAGLDTIALMMAEGMLDEFTVDGKPLTDANGDPINPALVDISQFKQTDQYRAAQVIGLILVSSKIAGGFALFAAPQGGLNTSSDFAKRYGIDSMNDAFKDVLENKQDDLNPMQSALSEFMKLQSPSSNDSPYASWDTMLPFTVSKYKEDPEGGTRALAEVQAAGDELVGWLRDDKTKDIESKYNDVYLFLAPRAGEFTWESWNILINVLNTRVLKSENERLGNMFAIVGQVNENEIKNHYEAQLSSAANPEEAEQIVEEMNAQIQMNRLANPYLKKAKETQNPVFAATNINTVLYRTRDMLNYLEEKYGSLSEDEELIRSSIEIYQYYKGKTNGLQGTSQQRSAAKNQELAKMEVQLSMLKQQSANAKQFIEAVIQQDPDYTFGVQ